MKIQCKVCNTPTNHEVIHEHKDSWDSEDFWGSDSWQIVKCMGCGDVSFKHIILFSEDVDPEGNLEETVVIYPSRGKDILIANSFYELSPTVRAIYKETIDCYNIQAWVLCAAGIRAIIEGICKHEKVLSGTVLNLKTGKSRVSKNLDGKIVGLKEKGILTAKHSELLHELRFLGNDAIHELIQPTGKELKLAIQVIEHTIENLYELEEKIEELKLASRKRKRTA